MTARLIYSTIASLDGYTADEHGSFDWAAPDEDVHRFVNDQEREVGTYYYGRRMYDVMVAWETMTTHDQPHVIRDYAEIWRSADKVVYSTTLGAVTSTKTRIERVFDAGAIRKAKTAATRDMSIGGPGLAAHAIEAGLVDEVRMLIVPAVVGGGTRALPDHAKMRLELIDERRFDGGVVHLGYRVRDAHAN